MGLLDMIIGWFFHPNMESAVDHSLQGHVFLLFTQIWSLLSTIPRRGVFLFFFAMLCCAAFLAGAFCLWASWSKKIIFDKKE